ncbi:MAG: hypothetical protein JXA89_18430 [Anaerolineae bacterium]|nr:hypothetical protein [Anaerolineae bacterium]
MDPVTVDRQEQIIANLADWIRDRDLESPAILFLQVNKPLALIGSQALLLLQPVLGFVGPMLGWFENDQVLAEYAALLETPGSIDRILSLLER